MTLRARQLAWQAAPRLLAAGLLLVPASMAPRWLQLWGATALVAAAGCVGWWLAGRLLRRLPALDRALAAAVLGVAVCWLIGLALGQAGALHGDAFRLVLALLCLGSVRATPHARSRTPQIGADVAGQSGVPVGGWRDRRRLARMEAALLVGVLAIAAGALVGALRQQRFAPPGRFSYDDTSYHLTTVATWAQRHDLSMPRFSYGDPRTAFYPFAAELAAWIATAPFAGGDFAARWVELPFALLTLFAAALVARRLGARGATPLLAPLLYLTVPNAFPDLALSAGNDHAVAFGVLATAHAGLLLARRRSVGRALYAGTALGLLLAIKLVGLLYAPALAVLLVLAAVTAPRPRCARWRRAAGVLAVAAGAALLVGGYAYLRNAVTAGNPLFPVPLRIGKLALPGWKEFALGGVMAAEPGFTPTTFPWTQTLLLGPLWRWTMLPAALLAPWLALALARRRRLVSAWLLALPLTFYGIFVELMEDHRGIRYLFAAVALAAVGAAWLVGRLPLPARAVATAIIGGAAVLPWLQRRPSWVGVLLAVLLAGAWLAQAGRVAWWRGRASAAAGRLAVAVLLAGLMLAPAGAAVLAGYEARRLTFAPAAAALETLAAGQPLRVAYAGWNQPDLFCGARLQNPLFMVPAASTLDALFYRWGAPVDDPFAPPPRRRVWLRNLERLRIDVVVWTALGGSDTAERRWLASTPQRFSRVYADGQVELWRVRR